MGAVADDPAILGLGVGVGLRKGDDALKAKFNAGIAKVIADGTYEAISSPTSLRRSTAAEACMALIGAAGAASTLELLALSPPGWGANLLRGLRNSVHDRLWRLMALGC